MSRTVNGNIQVRFLSAIPFCVVPSVMTLQSPCSFKQCHLGCLDARIMASASAGYAHRLLANDLLVRMSAIY